VESANEYGVTGSYMDRTTGGSIGREGASDVPNHVVLTAMYEVPSFGGGSRRGAGGWRFSASRPLQSAPVHRRHRREHDELRSRPTAAPRTVVGDPETAGERATLSRWFQTAAFATPRASLRQLAALGAPRPGLATLDTTGGKRHRPRRRKKFDGERRPYNLLNRANFTIPGYTLAPPTLASSPARGRRAR